MNKKPIALVSVSDRTNLIELCQKLKTKYQILATSGTAKHLAEAGISTMKIEEYTGAAEILGGRVKTLHPKVFAGILSRRTPEDRMTLEGRSIPEIDIVVCNLYPFRLGLPLHESIELIDIGGPSLIRAASKNYEHVTILIHPEDYDVVASKLLDGTLTISDREHLAMKAFQHVAWYDIEISNFFEQRTGEPFPNRFFLTGTGKQVLRYGENSHQKAVYYSLDNFSPFFKPLHGKDVSFNNIADFAAGIQLIQEFEEPGCVIIKHRSPCGAAENPVISQAFHDAFDTDSLSAYGGIAIFNRVVDGSTAEAIMEKYVDGIIAPGYAEEALEKLTTRKKIVLVEWQNPTRQRIDIKLVPNGFLVQDADTKQLTLKDIHMVSEKSPSDKDIKDLLWAWKVAKHTRSNAIILGNGTKTVGIGSGAPSRIDALLFALKKAGPRSSGSVMVSDAYFPFPDSVEKAAEAGVRAILAPSGSIRDKESVLAANKAGIPLVFSDIRCFLH